MHCLREHNKDLSHQRNHCKKYKTACILTKLFTCIQHRLHFGRSKKSWITKYRFRLIPGFNCSGVGAFPFQYIRNLKQNEAHSARAEPTHKGVISSRKDNYILVEFMYLVFTRMPGQSYRRRLRSLLLCLCYVFRALINSLVCWFSTSL